MPFWTNTCLATVGCILFACSFSSVADDNFEQALQAFQQQQQQTAYIHLKNVLQKTPDHIPAKVLMGKILLEKGYFSEAITEFEEALQKGADIELMLTELANSYLFSDEFQQVLKLGERYALSSASQFEWHLLAAAASLAVNDVSTAEIHFAAASELQPESPRLLNSLIALRLKQQRLNEAEQLLQKALTLSRDNAQTIQLKAELLQQQGQWLKAQELFEQAVALSPQDPILRRALLRNYISQNKFELAEPTLQHILQHSPGDPYALLLSAWLASLKQDNQQNQQYTEALSAQLWQLSKTQIDKQPSLLFTRALLSYVSENYEKARSDLVSYNQLMPADLNAVAMLSDVYIRQGDNSLAIQLLERHLEQLNSMPELAQRLVRLYIRSNRGYKAEQLVTSLRLQYPDNVDFAILHAAVLKQADQSDQARAVITEQIKKNSDNLLLQINRALLALDDGDYALALKVSEQLRQAEPDNAAYLNFNAVALIKLGQIEAATALLQRVLQVQPDHMAARVNLARLQIDQGNYATAIVTLEPIVQEHPQHKVAASLLALAYFRAERYPDAEKLLHAIDAAGDYAPATELLFDLYFKQQRYQSALDLVEQGLRSRFMDEVLLWKKARLLILLQQPEQAKAVMTILSDLVDQNTDKLLRLALLQREINELAASGQSLNEALALKPADKLLQLELANHYLLSNDLAAAQRLLQNMAKNYPKDANVALLQGDLALAQQNNRDAVNFYRQALRRDPSFQLAWVKLYQLAKSGAASTDFSTLAAHHLQAAPNNHWLRRLLAEHYVNSGHKTLAISQYQLLLDANQFRQDASLHNNLANLYIDNALDKALQHAELALQLQPKQAYTMDTYGWVLAKSGQYQQAVAILRQANALNATDPAIQYHIAYTLAKLDRQAEAVVMLQQLLASNIVFSERQAAELLLTQLNTTDS